LVIVEASAMSMQNIEPRSTWLGILSIPNVAAKSSRFDKIRVRLNMTVASVDLIVRDRLLNEGAKSFEIDRPFVNFRNEDVEIVSVAGAIFWIDPFSSFELGFLFVCTKRES
jgi:hypothetical protein